MSPATVEINVGDGLNRLVAELGGTEAQIRKALASTAEKVQTWLSARLARALAGEMDMNVGAIKGRIKKSAVLRTGKIVTANIWIGVKPIEAQRAGRPRQLQAGAKARRRFFEGAFVAAIYTSEEKIWVRLGSRHYDPETYPTARKHRPGDRFAPYKKKDNSHLRDSGRFPVVMARIPIAEEMAAVLPRYQQPTARRFEEVFEHELKYAVGWFR